MVTPPPLIEENTEGGAVSPPGSIRLLAPRRAGARHGGAARPIGAVHEDGDGAVIDTCCGEVGVAIAVEVSGLYAKAGAPGAVGLGLKRPVSVVQHYQDKVQVD